MKKLLALFLAVLMVVLSAPLAFAAEEKEIIDSYECDRCSMSWTLYDNYEVVFSGDCFDLDHSHKYIEAFKKAQEAKKIIFSDNFRLENYYNTDLNVFYLCEEYIVSKDNPYYSVEDGVLFNKDKTMLLNYPQGKTDKSYRIPETVKELCWYAFNVEDNVAYLNELIVPSNVEYITSYSCMNSSLEKVVFEDGDRTLIIGDMAFYGSEKLSSIVLPSSRVYSVVSSSFKETAYYNNDYNWENGVLYLDDIILDVKMKEMNSTYSIKNGTKTIADLASFGYFSEEDGKAVPVEVDVPESLDNIGAMSIFKYKEFPTQVFRIGTNYFTEPSSVSGDWLYMAEDVVMEKLEEAYIDLENAYMEWVNKWGENALTSSEAFADFPEECFYLTYTQDSWVHFAEKIEFGYIDEITFVEEGIKGLADETLHYAWFPNIAVQYINKGLILPESFEVLSGRTILDGKQYSTFLNYSVGEPYVDYIENYSVTFLNRNTEIFDNANTLAEGYTICGYKNSTAHKYAIKYNRKFIDLEQCTHEKTAVKMGLEATCKAEGITGDIYCQYCGILLKEGGETIPKSDHKFNHWYIKSETTCTTDGIEYSNCAVCNLEETRVYEKAPGHKLTTIITEYPDCNSFGEECTYCENCSYRTSVSLPKLEHEDNNRDGKCDLCGEDLTADCTCNCHKDGIMSIIYKIMKFFWKIFGMNKECSCGVVHY